MIGPTEGTAFRCGCIAADGNIGDRVVVIYTIELPRALEVRDVLRNAGLKATIGKSGFSGFSGKREYKVNLWARGGQWAVLYWSIKKWGMEKWLGHRKLEKLKALIGLGVQQPL